jgi:pyruvate/2-oxoglutarate dehydrogenase complex dihydrolipoamide acyltransferase (E2) component
VSRALAWLTQENLKRSVEDRLVYRVLLIKAVALALLEIPELNSVWTGTSATQCADIHVDVAVSLRGGGLVAPVPCGARNLVIPPSRSRVLENKASKLFSASSILKLRW